eukprot:4657348-Pyramimonas_sp.AAC.1
MRGDIPVPCIAFRRRTSSVKRANAWPRGCRSALRPRKGSPSKADMAKWMELATAESRDLILLFKNFCKRTCRGDFKKVTDQADERATTTA